jgi:hypothetical protein
LIPKVPTTATLKPSGPTRLVHEVNCKKIIKGDEEHIALANKVMSAQNFSFPNDDEIRDVAKNCDKFKDAYNYKNFIASEEELDFPIAYTILTYKDAFQTEELLRAIYRPQNIYCIHVDKSASVSVHDAISSISKCFPNVFISSKLEDVIYASFSRLQADLNCMSDLLHDKTTQWRYVINLPSQVYPLKTNAEIVNILKLYKGCSSIETLNGNNHWKRFYTSWKVVNSAIRNTNKTKAPPPYNITIGKGSAYGVFSRDFVKYAINDDKAKYLTEWLKDTYSPDELFWATLALNTHLQIPGVLPTGRSKLQVILLYHLYCSLWLSSIAPAS